MESAELRQRAAQKPAPEFQTQDKPAETHPAGPVKHGWGQQILRALLLALYMNATVLLIFVTQLIGCPFYLWNQRYFYRWMAWTKEHFGLVLVFMTDLWSPNTMKVYGDKGIRDQLWKTSDGRLETSFPERMLLIANHQIYTDWIYLWWIAYTSNLHGAFYIMLKKSLQKIPIVGQGMTLFGFIFMHRKWEDDEPRIKHRMQKLNKQGSKEKLDPMWFLMFPEGTNLSINGRNKSAEFAKKVHMKDMVHQVLPRSKGMFFCLRQLQESVEWVYDCTMAYEGVPPGEYGQDIYSLRTIYFAGRPPKSVSLHWRRFAVSTIPLSSEKDFTNWLEDRWREKDALMDRYLKHGSFDAKDDGDIERFLKDHPPKHEIGYLFDFKPEEMKVVVSSAKPAAPYEFLQIVLPTVAVYTVWRVVRRVVGAVLGR